MEAATIDQPERCLDGGFELQPDGQRVRQLSSIRRYPRADDRSLVTDKDVELWESLSDLDKYEDTTHG